MRSLVTVGVGLMVYFHKCRMVEMIFSLVML